MENITLIELTEEELALIIKKREEKAKREQAEILFKQIKDIYSQIKELGYAFRVSGSSSGKGSYLEYMGSVYLDKR